MPFDMRAFHMCRFGYLWECQNTSSKQVYSEHPQRYTRLSPVSLVLEALFPKTPFRAPTLFMLLCLGPRKNTDQPSPMGFTKLRLPSLEREYRTRTPCKNTSELNTFVLVILFENNHKNSHE